MTKHGMVVETQTRSGLDIVERLKALRGRSRRKALEQTDFETRGILQDWARESACAALEIEALRQAVLSRGADLTGSIGQHPAGMEDNMTKRVEKTLPKSIKDSGAVKLGDLVRPFPKK